MADKLPVFSFGGGRGVAISLPSMPRAILCPLVVQVDEMDHKCCSSSRSRSGQWRLGRREVSKLSRRVLDALAWRARFRRRFPKRDAPPSLPQHHLHLSHAPAMSVRALCYTCVRQSKIRGRLFSTMNSERDYNAAVQSLNSLQSNFSAVEAIRKQGPGWNERALPEMRSWVRRIDYEVCWSIC